MTKRSVASNEDIWPPLTILELCRRAYFEEFVRKQDRLMHSAAVGTIYLGAFRVNEVTGLLRSQFRHRSSLEKRDFIVIEKARIEKTGGRIRNVAIYPGDPISVPLEAHLKQLDERAGGEQDCLVFPVSDKTVLNVLDRISEGEAWTHLLRAMRDRFLSTAFDQKERKKIVGWSAGQKGRSWRFGEVEDRYAGLNWMFYADRLAKLSDSYWETEQLSPELVSWLGSLRELMV